MARVLANAVVDVIKPATPVGLGVFKVEVWGLPPYDYTRTYEIQAKNDTLSAQEAFAVSWPKWNHCPLKGINNAFNARTCPESAGSRT